ncbi:Cof-type HAD-IIB family hydrolase [Bacillus tianshenii]|uniref:HAD family hydrolase n=1 Tax=Sutcliffiella tianshenii TaxID=1463404 RepID=UPI001CD46016|nr:HAD family hydrolase [Bacillus tianshenii]MCA1321566.1 Cof-type HAD-IIB family hydrolase [Bacillus tianshenii]
MIYKLISFDVDGTIATAGQGAKRQVADSLVELEREGYTIVLNSGKNAAYLAGFARGLGLERPIVIGENGCIILDVMKSEEIQMIGEMEAFTVVGSQVAERFGDRVWRQPNQTALTIFPKNPSDVDELAAFMEEISQPYQDEINLYKHIDAVDILPKGADKGKALRELQARLGITKGETIAVGDSHNDIPMFAEAGKKVVVGRQIEVDGAVYVGDVLEAVGLIRGI